MADTAVLDVDGTLVDTNYQHALAWFRAFRSVDITLPVWRIHRHIGMGGDQLVTALLGEEVERAHGDALRARWSQEFAPMQAEIRPFEGAHELLVSLKERGFRLVLASSGKAEQTEAFIDLVGARELADAWTTSADVESSKPAPDLIKVAVGKVEGADAVMVGDSTWDFVAASRIGVPSLAVRTGGFSDEELREAGASAVFEDLPDLTRRLDETPLAKAEPRARVALSRAAS